MAPSYEPTPAIVRSFGERDMVGNDGEHPELIGELHNSVSFSRGWGDSGYKIQVVGHDCPRCGFDRMVRRVDVSPEAPDEVRYWCLYPNCAHFVRDSISYASHGNYPQTDVGEPTVWEPING